MCDHNGGIKRAEPGGRDMTCGCVPGGELTSDGKESAGVVDGVGEVANGVAGGEAL